MDWLGPGFGGASSVELGAGTGTAGESSSSVKPSSLIDLRVDGRRGGFLLRRPGGAVRDEVLHGYDHGEGLDLAGDAASGHLGAEVGDFPKTGQYLFAVEVQAMQSLGSCWTSCCCTAARCSSMKARTRGLDLV